MSCRRLLNRLTTSSLTLTITILVIGSLVTDSSSPHASAASADTVGSLVFEANRGQADPEVKFLARGSGYTLLLTPAQAVIVLQKPAGPTTSEVTRKATSRGYPRDHGPDRFREWDRREGS